ncbi:Ribosome assembly factor mrt4 [Diplonema papillatum]|nr:Ribosome assembly factor mrt4 [Diplonema papillatum]
MPKSKRERPAIFTKTKPKGIEHKDQLIENIRKAVDEYENCFTFELQNFRTTHLVQVRKDLRDSRIFMGNNKVMAVALGRGKEDSHKDNLYKMSGRLTGSCGLLFTNRSKKEIKDYFSTFEAPDYARAGTPATVDWIIPKGPLVNFGHEMMRQLTKLGLPISLDHGTLHLISDTKVCIEGEELSSQAAQLLKLWDLKSVQFKMLLTAHWTNGVAKAIAPPKS